MANKSELNGLRRGTARRGTATVELTVCLPVLVLIVVGTIETCNFIHSSESLKTATYEAARVMAMPGGTKSAGEQRCQEILESRGIEGAKLTTTPPSLNALEQGEKFTVEVTLKDYEANFFVRPFLSAVELRQSITFVKE